MNGGQPVVTWVILLAIVGFGVYRRTRRQPVRAWRAVAIAAVIVLLSGFGLVAGRRETALALEIAPLALAAGLALGWLLMRTITFWRDETTGELWMQGGLLYVAIWLATFALRLGISFVSGSGAPFGPPPPAAAGPPPNPTLALLSAELLFVSMGLWIARAAALVARSRRG